MGPLHFLTALNLALFCKREEEHMMRSERIASLRNQHTRLEHDLANIKLWPAADPGYIQTLKRQKLFVKDQLFQAVTRQQPVHRHA